MSSIQSYDVIIAGAGPAGSTCALTLSKQKLNVLLIDKAVFPRDKICGDAVSSTARRVLRQLSPEYEAELDAFAPKTNTYFVKMHSPSFHTLQVGFHRTAHCIKRIDFDNWLLQLAKRENRSLQLLQGDSITNVQSLPNYIEIQTKKGHRFRSKIIIGCDGAQSIVAKQLAGFSVNRYHYSAAVRQYYSNVNDMRSDTLEIYFLKKQLPGYFWIFPLAENQVNIGFGMLASDIQKYRVDLKSRLRHIVNEIPEVAARFKYAEALDEVKGFGLPLGSKKYAISGHRFMLCGDAASLIDPFSGEGIETAMESGKFAAEYVMKAFESDSFSAQQLAEYDKRVYRKMWPAFRNHYLLQQLMGKRTGLIDSLVRIGNIPFINRNITRWFY